MQQYGWAGGPPKHRVGHNYEEQSSGIRAKDWLVQEGSEEQCPRGLLSGFSFDYNLIGRICKDPFSDINSGDYIHIAEKYQWRCTIALLNLCIINCFLQNVLLLGDGGICFQSQQSEGGVRSSQISQWEASSLAYRESSSTTKTT